MNYSVDQKHQVLDDHQKGIPVAVLSENYGISRCTIYRWIREKEASTFPGNYTLREINYMKHRIEKLEKMVSILRTEGCSPHAPLKEKLLIIEQLQSDYDVQTLCETLLVAKGTFYNHIKRNKREDAWYIKRRKEYTILVRDTFYEFNQIFGADKLCAILRERGYHTTPAYISSIMRQEGLASVSTTSKMIYKNKEDSKRKNILQRNFKADHPNKAWVSDVTCFKYNEKWYYICVVIDLFSRKVISYHIAPHNSTQLICKVLRDAISKRNPAKGLIFHSDQGRQYTSSTTKKILIDNGIIQSFSQPGNPIDNAVAESFFSTMKKENLYRKEYRSEASFKKGVNEYIEFYNNRRPHGSLNYKTPSKYEEEYDIIKK